MNARRCFAAVPTFAALTVLASIGTGQNVLSYLPNAAGSTFVEECVPSPACGGPGVPTMRVFAGPAFAPAAAPLGAVCVDDRAGVIFATNGTGTIVRTPYPFVGAPAGSGTVTYAIPGVIGTVTGMAVDPAARMLFLTNGTQIFRVDPAAGMAVLCSWPASPLNILSGLDYDPARPGVLTAVSTAGEVAEYSICGALTSVTSPSYPWPGAVATGVTRDRTNASGGRVFVLYDNGELYDFSAGTLFRTGVAARVGLSFLPSPLRLPSGVSCGGVVPRPLVTKLPVAGSLAFGLDVRGLPAGTPAVLLVLGFPTVAAPLPTPAGDLWSSLGILTVAVPVAAGATDAHVPLSLGGIVPPLGIDVQWAVPCAAAPLGYMLTDGLQVEVGR